MTPPVTPVSQRAKAVAKVIQADRDAANAYREEMARLLLEAIRGGNPTGPLLGDDLGDENPLEQMLARHRLAHFEASLTNPPEIGEGELLKAAAKAVVDGASRTYRKRNGRLGSIEADDGEACDIVHSDLIYALQAALTDTDRAAVEQPSATGEGEPVAWRYTGDDGSVELILNPNGEYARRLLERGYTEQPLFVALTPSPDVKAAVEREREACAKVAEERGEQYREPTQADYDRQEGCYAAATAIRARSTLSATREGEGE